MTEKPLRADAARNRARVLEVAYRTFAEEGLAVPIDEIARRAGVGAGTVYRHFPTKEALFRAIAGDRIGQLVREARELTAADPGNALFRFLERMVVEASVDQGLVEALAGVGVDLADAVPDAEQEFLAVLAELIGHAQRAGAIRADVDAYDLKTLLVGVQAMQRYRGDVQRISRAIAVIVDGLRPGR